VGAADVITSNKFLVIGQGVWILWGSKTAPAQPVIRLTRSKAAVWTVDGVARLMEIFLQKNSYSFIYFDPQ